MHNKKKVKKRILFHIETSNRLRGEKKNKNLQASVARASPTYLDPNPYSVHS